MATTPVAKTLSPETVEQVRFIIDRLFKDGQQWIKSIASADWRRERYLSSRGRPRAVGGPPATNIAEEIQAILGYLEKDASSLAGIAHSYIVIKPDNGCLKENGIVLLRPVLKTNFDNLPQLNFHIWFHTVPGGGQDHLMTGWRFEEPEGEQTTHNYFHAQPLRDFEGAPRGLHARFSEHFPTFPLPASDTVELCLNALLVASGKEMLRSLIRNGSNPEVRAAANLFWTKIFKTETAT